MMKKKERTPTDVQNITPKKKIDGQLKFVFYSIEDLSEVAGIDDNWILASRSNLEKADLGFAAKRWGWSNSCKLPFDKTKILQIRSNLVGERNMRDYLVLSKIVWSRWAIVNTVASLNADRIVIWINRSVSISIAEEKTIEMKINEIQEDLYRLWLHRERRFYFFARELVPYIIIVVHQHWMKKEKRVIGGWFFLRTNLRFSPPSLKTWERPPSIELIRSLRWTNSNADQISASL